MATLTESSNNHNEKITNENTDLPLSRPPLVTISSSDSLKQKKTKSLSSFSVGQDEYTLTDIYEDAAVIGSELEKIINNYGSDVLVNLMPKVIKVLELLEHLTRKNEQENDELVELRQRVHTLESEKHQRSNEREKLNVN